MLAATSSILRFLKFGSITCCNHRHQLPRAPTQTPAQGSVAPRQSTPPSINRNPPRHSTLCLVHGSPSSSKGQGPLGPKTEEVGSQKPPRMLDMQVRDTSLNTLIHCRQRSHTPRNRRLKCDEVKPVCGRCFTLKLPCKGATYSTITSLSPASPTTRRPLYAIPAANRAPQIYGSAAIKDLIHFLPNLLSLLNFDIAQNPASASQGQLLVRCGQLAAYIDFLPSRSGHSLTLDSAIQCLVAGLRDLAVPAAHRSPIKTLACYSRALECLQSSLSHPKQRLSSETLCATQLLGIFEVRSLDYGCFKDLKMADI